MRLKGRLYESCVRSAMLCGSETWAVKVEPVRNLERTEMRMVRLIIWSISEKKKDKCRVERKNGD